MPAAVRGSRDERRRRLGQNFLRSEVAERFVATAGIAPRELVVDIGAGSGALTRAAARRGADVIAIEIDPVWAARLRIVVGHEGPGRVGVLCADFLTWRLPDRPFRVLGCLPFGATTSMLRRLLDDPETPLVRADLVLQWEVARKRAAATPNTLLSTTWAPWWEFRLGCRVAARDFRPVPRVPGGVLVVTRRAPPLLPTSMASAYRSFVRRNWPFTWVAGASGLGPIPCGRQSGRPRRRS